MSKQEAEARTIEIWTEPVWLVRLPGSATHAGPVSLDQVRRGLAHQKLDARAEIARQGQSEWRLARSYIERVLSDRGSLKAARAGMTSYRDPAPSVELPLPPPTPSGAGRPAGPPPPPPPSPVAQAAASHLGPPPPPPPGPGRSSAVGKKPPPPPPPIARMATTRALTATPEDTASEAETERPPASGPGAGLGEPGPDSSRDMPGPPAAVGRTSPGCPRCRSSRLVDGVELVVGYAGPAAAHLEGRRVIIKARICGDCGAAELYADEPASLYEAYACSRA